MILERCVVFLATMAVLVSCCAVAPQNPRQVPALTHAAPSIDELVDRLLLALAANDSTALQELRVTESEYCSVITPGTVEVGQPLREMDATSTKYFWSLLDAKSRDLGRQLLLELGGKKLQRQEIHFTHAVHAYAGYTAHGQVRVLVSDESGTKREVRSGTVAQIGDQYKFIGLNWND